VLVKEKRLKVKKNGKESEKGRKKIRKKQNPCRCKKLMKE
jgi:hypothetical protein